MLRHVEMIDIFEFITCWKLQLLFYTQENKNGSGLNTFLFDMLFFL